MTDEELLEKWCEVRLLPYTHIKTFNFNRSSYGLKHFAERDLKIYISHEQFKNVMAKLNVPHTHRNDNQDLEYYPISNKFFNNFKRKFKIAKEDVNRISYKDDVDIIYADSDCIVCKKDSIIDLGCIYLFEYAGRKEQW